MVVQTQAMNSILTIRLIANLMFHKSPQYESLLTDRKDNSYCDVYIFLLQFGTSSNRVPATAAQMWFRPASHFFSAAFSKKK